MLFEVNGETHNIMFRYIHRKGIEAENLIFDGYPAKLIDGYPSLLKVVQICVAFIHGDIRSIMRDFTRFMYSAAQQLVHKL